MFNLTAQYLTIESVTPRIEYRNKIEKAVEELPEKEKILIKHMYMAKDADYISEKEAHRNAFQPPIHH